jgi:serine/threonine-protein kinase/endoribonuclease IRE1
VLVPSQILKTMYPPTQILTHLLLLLIPCLLLLSATPSPSPNPYPAAVSIPSRSQTWPGHQYNAKVAPPEISHDLLDYVIISTIDGALHAVERDGGKVKWSLRDGVSPLVGGMIKGKGEDEYIVEPLSGGLYVFEGEDSQSLRKLPLSVEQLYVALSP